MQYCSFINSLIKKKLNDKNNIVSFGQNISSGSCLGGLTRDINKNNNLVLNTTNNEYSMSGLGFGLMLENVNGIYFHKQQDFTLLGMDHFVHTWNALSIDNLKSSYTIFSIVVDNGFEGPQSCINMLKDITSISNIPGYTISNRDDAEYVINNYLVNPGVRFVCVSQKLFKTEIIEISENPVLLDSQNVIYKYFQGNDVTILCANFSFTEGLHLNNYFLKKELKSSLINVSSAIPTNWEAIIKEVKKSKKLVILDDSKSKQKELYNLSYQVLKAVPDCKISINNRGRDYNDSIPNSDEYYICTDQIYNELFG